MKKKIIIKGKVHEVGYRAFLLGTAESFEISRFFADNIFINSAQAIEVLIDDEENKVNDFIEIIKKKKPENAEVEAVDILDYKGNVMKIENYYRYLTANQLSTIANYGGKMLTKQDSMLGKQDSMLEKQDSMLGKQDSMLEKQDKMLEKQDKMLEKQDEHIKITKEGFEKVTKELKGFKELHEEIRELRTEFIKLKGQVTRIERKIEA